MCGIVGAIGIEYDESALTCLRHRGPDGYGVKRIRCGDLEVVMGHTRLAILDLSEAGDQPMSSSDGRWWLTFNGEIYNHLDLRTDMENTWRGHSDTETLIELIASYGIKEALVRLNGMFAFAAFDTCENILYIARDPFGIKPVYFFHQGRRFAFASEVRALKAFGVVGGLDMDGLLQFLSLRYVPSPVTLWHGVRRLPPGHLARFDLGTGELSLSCFVDPVKEQFSGTMEEAIEAYQGQLARAVTRQLLSDVPVGVLLSGGVDSALIAAMARDSGAELPCFTVGFGESHEECEIEDARQTAHVLGLPFHAVITTPEQLQNVLPNIVQAVEEPLGTTSVMPMWFLVQRVSQEFKVVLTGQGSDEPWGGYYRYQVELVRNRLPWPDFWKRVQAVLSPWKTKPDFLERGLSTLSQPNVVQQLLQAWSLFTEEERRLLIDSEASGGAENTVEYWLKWLGGIPCLSSTERMMRLDARMNLADDLLLYGDKISMAVSLEARVPMLDIELMHFVESLPIDYRIRWRQGKVVHKAMAQRYLPSDIVNRPKKGFQVPFGEWSRGPWRRWVEMHLFEGLNGILQRQGVERLWRQHLAKKPDRTRQIFALLMLALWRAENR